VSSDKIDNKNINEALREFAQRVVFQSRRNLTKGGKNFTKELWNSINSSITVNPNSFGLQFFMSPHGVFQDRGVKGVSSGKSLSGYKFGTGSGQKGGLTKGINQWVRRKQIQFRNKETGQFISYEQTARTIIRSIWQKGIKPSMFFTRPFEKYYKKLPKEVTEKYALDMVNLFNTITSENFKKLA